jgi:hypothetical protein
MFFGVREFPAFPFHRLHQDLLLLTTESNGFQVQVGSQLGKPERLR